VQIVKEDLKQIKWVCTLNFSKQSRKLTVPHPVPSHGTSPCTFPRYLLSQ